MMIPWMGVCVNRFFEISLHALSGVRVDGAAPRGLWPPAGGRLCRRVVKEKVLREALIKSLSDFILAFLFNARNQSTRIASYLRRLMTQHWIKIHMKFDSAN